MGEKLSKHEEEIKKSQKIERTITLIGFGLFFLGFILMFISLKVFPYICMGLGMATIAFSSLLQTPRLHNYDKTILIFTIVLGIVAALMGILYLIKILDFTTIGYISVLVFGIIMLLNSSLVTIIKKITLYSLKVDAVVDDILYDSFEDDRLTVQPAIYVFKYSLDDRDYYIENPYGQWRGLFKKGDKVKLHVNKKNHEKALPLNDKVPEIICLIVGLALISFGIYLFITL